MVVQYVYRMHIGIVGNYSVPFLGFVFISVHVVHAERGAIWCVFREWCRVPHLGVRVTR